MLILVFEVGATLIEAGTGYWFLEDGLTVSRKKWLLYGPLVLLMVTIGMLANSIQLYSGWTTIFAVVYLGITFALVNKKNVGRELTKAIFYFVLVYIVDFAVLSLQGIILEKPQLPLHIVETYSHKRCAFLLISKSILILLCFLVKLLLLKMQITVYSLGAFPLLAAIIVHYLTHETLREVDFEIISFWILFLALWFTVFFLINIYHTYTRNKKESEINSLKSSLLLEHYEELIKSNSEQSRMAHDVKGHLLAVSQYIQMGKGELAKKYLDDLIEPMQKTSAISWTGNTLVDCILNTYIEKAKNNEVAMTIDADQVAFAHIADKDLCALFWNLLENAIEEVTRHKNTAASFINVYIRKYGEIVIISIENSLLNVPKMIGGKLQTWKEDKPNHGIGLGSIQDIVKKYNGDIKYQFDNNKFEVNITFFTGT